MTRSGDRAVALVTMALAPGGRKGREGEEEGEEGKETGEGEEGKETGEGEEGKERGRGSGRESKSHFSQKPTFSSSSYIKTIRSTVANHINSSDGDSVGHNWSQEDISRRSVNLVHHRTC